MDIGVHNVFTVQVLAGSSLWPQGQTYVTFLPSTIYMTPHECRQGRNKNSIKMFSSDKFCEDARTQKWDRLRIVCTQPFAKSSQFGLSLFNVTENTADDNRSESSPKSGDKLSPGRPLPAPLNDKKSTSDIQQHFFGSKLFGSSAASQFKTQLLDEVSSPEARLSTQKSLPRSAQLLLAAASKTPRYKAPSEWTPGSQKLQSSPVLPDRISPMNSPHPPGPDPTEGIKPHSVKTNDGFSPPSRLCKDQTSPSAKRSARKKPRFSFEEEVAAFLRNIDVTKLDMETFTFADLRHRFEKIKFRKLSKEERKVFFRMAQERVAQAFDNDTNSAGRNGHVAGKVTHTQGHIPGNNTYSQDQDHVDKKVIPKQGAGGDKVTHGLGKAVSQSPVVVATPLNGQTQSQKPATPPSALHENQGPAEKQTAKEQTSKDKEADNILKERTLKKLEEVLQKKKKKKKRGTSIGGSQNDTSDSISESVFSETESVLNGSIALRNESQRRSIVEKTDLALGKKKKSINTKSSSQKTSPMPGADAKENDSNVTLNLSGTPGRVQGHKASKGEAVTGHTQEILRKVEVRNTMEANHSIQGNSAAQRNTSIRTAMPMKSPNRNGGLAPGQNVNGSVVGTSGEFVVGKRKDLGGARNAVGTASRDSVVGQENRNNMPEQGRNPNLHSGTPSGKTASGKLIVVRGKNIRTTDVGEHNYAMEEGEFLRQRTLMKIQGKIHAMRPQGASVDFKGTTGSPSRNLDRDPGGMRSASAYGGSPGAVSGSRKRKRDPELDLYGCKGRSPPSAETEARNTGDVACPLCGGRFPDSQIEFHAALCGTEAFPALGTQLGSGADPADVASPSSYTSPLSYTTPGYSSVVAPSDTGEKGECPICGAHFPVPVLPLHADTCAGMQDSFQGDNGW